MIVNNQLSSKDLEFLKSRGIEKENNQVKVLDIKRFKERGITIKNTNISLSIKNNIISADDRNLITQKGIEVKLDLTKVLTQADYDVLKDKGFKLNFK